MNKNEECTILTDFLADQVIDWPTVQLTRIVTSQDTLASIDSDPFEYDLWLFKLKAKFWPMSIRLKAKIVIIAGGPAFRTFDKWLMTVFHIFKHSDILSTF